MDCQPLKTHVYVHSPLIECSSKGEYYTSYAIHLMSANPCFTHHTSYIRRRYSEFVQLRQLLVTHHPTLKPSNLPPKKFVQRFSDEFIEERMKGLQKFLRRTLDTPVYLSDKGLHLFLQSSSSMSKINKECLGDIPAPPLLSVADLPVSYSDTSSSRSSDYFDAQLYGRSLQNLVLEDVQIILNQITIPSTSEVDTKTPKVKSSLRKSDSKPFAIPNRNDSLESSPSSSPPSSHEGSCNSFSEPTRERNVSFNDRVEIAIITKYGISVLR